MLLIWAVFMEQTNQQEIKYLTEKQTSKSLKLGPVPKFTFVKYQK